MKEKEEDVRLILNRGKEILDSATVPVEWRFSQELIEKNPGNDSAYYSLGQGYYGLRAYNEAIKALKRATEIKPDNFDYRSFLGKVYQAKKDYPAARDAYIETLRLNPDKQNHYIQLAWLYYFRLDPEKDKAFEVL